MTETPSTTVRRDHLSVYIGARACLPVVLQSLIAELEGKFENNDGLAKVLARPRRRPSPRTACNLVIIAAGLLGSLRVVWRVRDPHGVEVLSFPPRGRVQAEEVSVQVGGFRFELTPHSLARLLETAHAFEHRFVLRAEPDEQCERYWPKCAATRATAGPAGAEAEK
jgi:hypothetical protein